jgi:hypothetical protein
MSLAGQETAGGIITGTHIIFISPSIYQCASRRAGRLHRKEEHRTMKPLLFIVLMTGLGILVSLQFGSKVTWFNYYAGAMAGLLISGALLGYWSNRKRKKEEEQERKKRGRKVR